MAISRSEALRAIAQHRGERIVVSTMQVVRPWHSLSPSELNLTCIGFMGGASTLGLGVALAQPERRVVILDGDGSLLMQLGSLATIAGAAPANFCHILFQNGVYETSGSQPIASADAIDFAQMAQGAGYKATYTFDDVGRFREEVAGILDEDGPVFVVLKIDQRDEPVEWDAPGVSALEETRTVRRALTGGDA
ncbi:MAG TPA: thiamine pyrophosphate-dependent enzyme [Dehalococcoidia bacterium]|jgi:phosphonopyruvate decarboxylase